MIRLSVSPGVLVRRVGPEEKGALDEWHIQNASFWLDIRIILRTIGIVLFEDGFGSAGESKLPDPGDERSDSPTRRREVHNGLATRQVAASARLLSTAGCGTDENGFIDRPSLPSPSRS
jgi:Bacterial sugar transferase